MQLDKLIAVLNEVHGCTFASLDCRVREGACIRETKGEQVMLFANAKASGYERKVKRELSRIGRDPDGFRVSELPWGERLDNLPIITHRGFYYLQTIFLRPGSSKYFIGVKEVPRPSYLRERFTPGQGLPSDKQVIVNTYNIEHISSLRLKGEHLS